MESTLQAPALVAARTSPRGTNLTDSIETFEGYPQEGNEYAICEVWNFEGRVAAVWWAPQY